MIESKLRSPFQRYGIEPLLRIPFVRKAEPIFLSFLGLFFGLLIPFFLPLGCIKIALLCLFLAGMFDILDGTVARFQNLSSPEGAACDLCFDRIVEFAIILALFFVAPKERALGALMMMGSVLFCVTTFLCVAIFTDEETEKSCYYSPGLMERAEAFVFFGLMMLLPSLFSWLSGIFTALVFWTGGIRLYEFYLKKSIPNARIRKSKIE